MRTMYRLSGGAHSPAANVPDDLDCNKLMNKAMDVEVLARVTHTESYFYVLIKSSLPNRAAKIQNRMACLAERRVSTALLQPVLWRKVLAVSTARR